MFSDTYLNRYYFPICSLILAGLLLISSPTQAQTQTVYTVRSGDYLLSIAKRYGISLAEINQANNLKSDVIFPGQKLNIPAPLLKLDTGDIRFARPCRKQGKILKSFGPYKENGLMLPHTGVEFLVPHDTRLTSCSHGIVRHIGMMQGLGTLMIIEHGGGYHTVMGPFSVDSLQVVEGDAVVQGQTLGKIANAPRGKNTFAHLELRKDTVAIDPTFLLR